MGLLRERLQFALQVETARLRDPQERRSAVNPHNPSLGEAVRSIFKSTEERLAGVYLHVLLLLRWKI